MFATFSGDKLMGGPQAGILAGKREPLERIRKNPLFRALRVDKLTIAALEATASLYLRGHLDSIPALRMLRLSPKEIAARATRLAEKISARAGFSAAIREGESVLGAAQRRTGAGHVTPGSHPCVARRPDIGGYAPPPQACHYCPRGCRTKLVLDLRTVFEDQEDEIARAVEKNFVDAVT